ncbi:MAG TPA: LamG domain-containing protein [Tepidisphaeraceae bacterium]|nr:LamG domain-containing protein [Tepidisphaeraceae bacterium]
MALSLAAASSARAALVVHYGFEEGLGTTALDSATADGTPTPVDNGSLRNGVTYVPGIVGSFAVNLDGADDDVLVNGITGNDQDVISGSGGATLAAWVRMDTITGATRDVVQIRRNGSSSEGRAVLRVLSNGAIQVGVRTADTTAGAVVLDSAAGLVATDTWAHVAGVIDIPNDTITIYLNGVAVATSAAGDTFGAATAFPNTLSNAVLFGSNGGQGNRVDGLIDDGRIYNEALDASAIAALVPEPGVVGLAAVAGLGALGRRRRRRKV